MILFSGPCVWNTAHLPFVFTLQPTAYLNRITMYHIRQHSLSDRTAHDGCSFRQIPYYRISGQIFLSWCILWNNGESSAEKINFLHGTIWKEVYLHLSSTQLNISSNIPFLFKSLSIKIQMSNVKINLSEM